VGSYRKGRWSVTGGILAALSEGHRGDDEGDGDAISVPDEYRAEALIYGVVSKGYLSFQSLADGSVSIKTLFRAKHLAEFDEWVKQKARQAAERKNDVVEYFE
jgi:hypothetical protein